MFLELEQIISLSFQKINWKFLGSKEEKVKEIFDSNFVIPSCLQIAPFEKLTFGTTLPIVVSRILSKKDVEITPDVIAAALSNELRNAYGGEWEIFVGEEAFVNFRPIETGMSKLYLSMLDVSPKQYFNDVLLLSKIDLNISRKEILDNKFKQEIINREIPESVQINFHNKIKKLEEEVLIKLYFISDYEADLTYYLSDKFVSDNSVWVVSKFNEILSLIENLNNLDVSFELTKKNIMTLKSTLICIDDLKRKIERLLLISPFLLRDSLRQSCPEIYFKEIRDLMITVLGGWNDPGFRSFCLGPDKLAMFSDREFIKKSLNWINLLQKEALRLYL